MRPTGDLPAEENPVERLPIPASVERIKRGLIDRDIVLGQREWTLEE